MTNLEKWHHALEKCESPNQFITWSWYSAVSAALERRVCYRNWPTLSAPTDLFTNLFVVFVGPPGAGKSMPLSLAKNLFKLHGGFESRDDYLKQIISIAPNSVTVQSLWSRMATTTKVTRVAPTQLEAWPAHALSADGTPRMKEFLYLSTPIAVFCDQEFSSFLPEASTDIVSFLQESYTCQDFENLTISSGSRFLKATCMTLIAATNPQWIVFAQKNGLLQQGLSARTVFVWGEKKRHKVSYFEMTPEGKESYAQCSSHVKSLAKLFLRVDSSPSAQAWLDNWYLSGGDEPINKSPKLIDYYARKRVHLIKLAMVVHFSDSLTPTLEVSDFEKALALLNLAERDMHRALAGSGTNPTYDVADMIYNHLASTNGVGIPSVQLLARAYPHCPQGRTNFDEALEYLLSQDMIEGPFTDERNRPFYRAQQTK